MADESRCAFCDGTMRRSEKVAPVQGETGGAWWQDTWQCNDCAAAVIHEVVFKVGNVRESWGVDVPPSKITRATDLHCPSCDGLLASAWPPDVAPQAATGFRIENAALGLRQTEHLCASCSTRLVLTEELSSQWLGSDGTLPSDWPRPFAKQ